MEAAHVPWRPLGELFVARGLITEAELETALAEQAATGKRLGEILVGRGLVSGPELTGALMDQLGAEISKEEGYGSGLWAEIKRRHRRARSEGDEEGEEGIGDAAAEAEIALVLPIEEASGVEPDSELPSEAEEAQAAGPELVVAPEPPPEPDLWPGEEPPEPELWPGEEPQSTAADPELEQELEEIRAEYTPPAEWEAAEEPEPEREPTAGAAPEASADEDEIAELRAELAAAQAELAASRADLAHLQDMLADAMTALTALTAEAAGEQRSE